MNCIFRTSVVNSDKGHTLTHPYRRNQRLEVKFVIGVKGLQGSLTLLQLSVWKRESGHFAVAMATKLLSGRLHSSVIMRRRNRQTEWETEKRKARQAG